MLDASVFDGCLPALMTPWTDDGQPDYAALVESGRRLVAAGMRGVVYCGSMGDWPLLTDEQRQVGVAALVDAGLPVVVGTGAIRPSLAADHARHAAEIGAAGLMVIPRLLSRGTSLAAQRDHLAGVLAAAPNIPAIIYNSPYYGFQTRADLFFELRAEHRNLVGFKEFGGRESLTYAAEHITSGDADLRLLVGVDTQVVHGVVNCGATGAITGIGCALPEVVLELFSTSQRAAQGDPEAYRRAREIDLALQPLAEFDQGTDLVLFFKHLCVRRGYREYVNSVHTADRLSDSQRGYADAQFDRFMAWWSQSRRS